LAQTDGGPTIKEIVVTAQKVAQPLQEVPASVSVLSGDLVRESGLADLADVVEYAPNVQFYENAPPFASIGIRGFATPPSALGLEPSVGLMIDGVSYGRSTYAQDAIFDLERLEVVRGPQGALFGKNTVAGLLNFTTGAPSFEANGRLLVSIGSLAERRVEAAVTFPVVKDVLAARMAVRADREDLGIFDTTRREDDDSDDIAGRAKVHWIVRPGLSADLAAWASHMHVRGSTAQLRRASARSLAVFRLYDPETEADDFDGRAAIDARTFSERSARALSLRPVWAIGDVGFARDVELTVIGAWSQVSAPFLQDPDFSPVPFGRLGSDGPNRYRQGSLEVRLSGTAPLPEGWGDHFELLCGMYGERVESTVRQLFDIDLNGALAYVAAGSPALQAEVAEALPVRPPSLLPPAFGTERIVSQTERERSGAAGFVQGTWRFTDRWSLTGGIRLDYDRQEGDLFSRNEGLGIGAAIAGQKDFASRLERTELDLSPRLALGYAWSEELTLFASAARDVKAGGFAEAPLNPDHERYAPEKAVSFEIGARALFFDSRLMLDATGFWTRLDDLQIRSFTGTTFTVDNADRATSRGFEIEARWLPPLSGSAVATSVGFADARSDRFPNAPAVAGSSSTTQDLSGRALPFAPKLSAALLPSWVFPLSTAYGVDGLVGVDVLYQGGRYLDGDLDPETFQDAVVKLNLRLGVRGRDPRWSLTVHGRNLTGAEETMLIIDQPLIPGNYVSFPLPDAPTFLVDLAYQFG